MMKHTRYLIPAIAILLAASCSSNSEEKSEQEVRKLFEQTCKLTKLYTDSIKSANDTTAVEALMTRFDERMTDLNFSVTADTDLKLTEGQNDTIASLIAKLRSVYNARLDSVSGRHALPDSIPHE